MTLSSRGSSVEMLQDLVVQRHGEARSSFGIEIEHI